MTSQPSITSAALAIDAGSTAGTSLRASLRVKRRSGQQASPQTTVRTTTRRREALPAVSATFALAMTAIASLTLAAGPAGAAVSDPMDHGSPAGSSSVALLAEKWGDDTTGEDEKASARTGLWEADKDWGSMYNVTKLSGAHVVWGTTDPIGRKVTGKGIDVAVIDTGVSPVKGLNAPGKILNGPDLSFDGQSGSTPYLDSHGHGTHMAGIIAGRDPEVPAGNENDVKHFVGVAPDARIVNMKVGTAEGAVDVSQVIAAIDWLVENRNRNGLNVRVINLSYGTSSTNEYGTDPLARAVENAWKAGVVVVVAAGNDGAAAGRLRMPAADPFVISVGATDHRGSVAHSDDLLTDFTNRGTTSRRADLLAPGKSVVGLRVPGAFSDVKHPEGMVTGDTRDRFFRGSGTSQAAAVVSGAVALLLQDRPELNPDQVKAILKGSAEAMPAESGAGKGAGQLDIDRAIVRATPLAVSVAQLFPASTGLGSLENSRGGLHVVDPALDKPLTGERDAQGRPWNGAAWSAASALGSSWSGGVWNGSSWSGSSWSGSSWSGSSWSGSSWSGSSWSDYAWSGSSWSGSSWSGSSWSGSSWSGSSWSGSSWSGSSWSGGV